MVARSFSGVQDLGMRGAQRLQRFGQFFGRDVPEGTGGLGAGGDL